MSNATVMWSVSSISLMLLAALMSLSIGVLFAGLGNEASARALAELESARLADAVNQSDGYVLLVNSRGEVIYANSRARALAQERFRLDRLPEWATLLQGEAWAGRTEFRPPQGEPMLLSGTMSPVRDETGSVTHVLATLRDVSRERDLEMRLQQGQKLEAIGTLAGGIAHDFNNLLQPIVANTESVQAQLDADHESQPLLIDIRQSAERARALVRRILTFTRAMEHERGVVNVGTLLVETERLLRTTLPANVNITVTSTPDVHVLAEAGELQQVLLNLSTNAAHAMPQGGTLHLVACVVETSDDDDAHSAFGDRERVACLSVTDNGTGMDAATLDRAFDPFFTTKGPGRGTGLGLAMVHGTVTALGGIVVPRSTPDRGTSMRVYLPLAAYDRFDGGAVASEPLAAQRHRVFVIDDDQAVLTSTLRLLSRLGYDAVGCTNPAEALAQAGEPGFAADCVLTDYSMPVMSGLELAHGVRALHPSLPIVLTTGFLEHDELSRTGESGISHILPKPFSSAELQSALTLAIPVTSRP
jgi:signal transduction histidine kinase/ActR/RegA family two-component response regulator